MNYKAFEGYKPNEKVTVVFENLKPNDFKMLVNTLNESSLLFCAERTKGKNYVRINHIEVFRAFTFPFPDKLVNVYREG